MVAVRSLSESDVATIREELAAGRPSTVWFTPGAVGVAVGGSAKVASVAEVAEGEFIQVRPAGSQDLMFCSPSELTRARPPRKRKPQTQPQPEPTRPAADRGAEPVADPGTRPVADPSTRPVSERAPAPRPVPDAPSARTARRSAERRPAAAEVTVTLLGTAEGEWTAEVTVGKKRVVRSVAVQPAEVAKAARSLPTPVAQAIEASLEVARKRQTERVDQLRAELEAAQSALKELNG